MSDAQVDKCYLIVCFVGEKIGKKKSIELVPKKWAHINKKTKKFSTYYPPPDSKGRYYKEDLTLVDTLCKNNVEAPEDWSSFESKVCGWAGMYVNCIIFITTKCSINFQFFDGLNFKFSNFNSIFFSNFELVLFLILIKSTMYTMKLLS